MSNKEISRIFKALSKVMEIHGENDFKTRSYSIASFNIDRLEQPLEGMAHEDIAALKGIGPAISAKIAEIIETGNLSLLQRYLEKTPPGILEMIRLKGIGGKKIHVLWKDAGIESLEALLEAAKADKIAKMKGFGKKTQDTIIKAIEYLSDNRQKSLYATVEQEADQICAIIKERWPKVEVSFTGDLRRRNIIVNGIELLIASNDQAEIDGIKELEFLEIEEEEEEEISGFTSIGTAFTIYFTTAKEFPLALFKTTGNVDHVAAVAADEKERYNNEADIYIKKGLQYIEPELREGMVEVDLAKENKIPELVIQKDVKGMIHAHSTYSDGTASIEDMARACIEKGYSYMGITDHSKSAFYAGGLLPDAIKRQHAEIDKLNEKLAPFMIFKGIESDILNDGSLDYDEEVLSSFDFVIASIHSNLKMTEEKATERLINAAKNPYTSIMGHVSGRLLLRRDGYPIDYRALINACAEYGTAIEINANPHRLDIDWSWIPYAIGKGVKIAINPDAHSINGIDDIHYGVLAARKGYLSSKHLLNYLSAEEFKAFVGNQRKHKLAL